MILLYTALIFCLVLTKFLLDRRVARLEKKFIQTSDAADTLLAEAILKDHARAEPVIIAGVAVTKKTQVKEVKPDAAQLAKRQYLLGQLVQKRDRLEDKHLKWERRADRITALLARVRACKGRKVPYTFGVLDVASTMYLVDRFGLGEYLNFDRLAELVNTCLTN
jgi:hypothetical protein